MTTHTINIKYGERCPECRKDSGLCDNGICMGCTAKAIDPKARMKSDVGRAVQEHIGRSFTARRPASPRTGEREHAE